MGLAISTCDVCGSPYWTRDAVTHEIESGTIYICSDYCRQDYILEIEETEDTNNA